MSVEFEPIRLGRRGRRIDPIAVGVARGGDRARLCRAQAVGRRCRRSRHRPSRTVDGPPQWRTPSRPTTPRRRRCRGSSPRGATPRCGGTRSRASVRRHDTWGIRAIVVQVLADSPLDARQRFIERWYPLPSRRRTQARPTLVDSNERAILALGVTFPPDHTPLDVRIWRRTDAGFDWVDTEPLDPVPSGGAFLYRTPGTTPATPRPWASGEYRVDILVDGTIRRYGIAIPDRFSNVPATPERPSLRDLGPLVAPTGRAADRAARRSLCHGRSRRDPAATKRRRCTRRSGAWLDVDPGTGREPRGFVARASLPRATGLGVQLPAGSVVIVASAGAPCTRATPRRNRNGSIPSRRGIPTARGAVQGARRLRLGARGLSNDRPLGRLRGSRMKRAGMSSFGRVRSASRRRLLAAARGWARFAGANGVILGTAEPLGVGADDGPIELLTLRSGRGRVPGLDGDRLWRAGHRWVARGSSGSHTRPTTMHRASGDGSCGHSCVVTTRA